MFLQRADILFVFCVAMCLPFHIPSVFAIFSGADLNYERVWARLVCPVIYGFKSQFGICLYIVAFAFVHIATVNDVFGQDKY